MAGGRPVSQALLDHSVTSNSLTVVLEDSWPHSCSEPHTVGQSLLSPLHRWGC